MVTESKSILPKASTKEVQCQSSDCETSMQEPVGQVTTPKSGRVGIFNAEDFLSRAQMNDKINNILRSPTKPPNGVRQRSVYTNNPSPQTSMRFGMAVGQLSQRVSNLSLSSGMGSSGRMDRGSSCSLTGSASVGTNTITINNGMAKDQAGSQSARPYVHLPGIHMPNMPPYPAGTMQEIDTGNRTRNGTALTARYHNTAPYGFDGEQIYCQNSQQLPPPMPPPPYALGRVSSTRMFELENNTPPPCPGSGPIAMPNGTIQLRLREGVRIDMTLDKAVRVLNQRSMVAVALSRNCSNSAMIHPNGRILQSGSKVEIVTYDGMKGNNFVRYAKMWYKGVSFTSEACALIYLVDTAGTRTTTDTFTDLTKDYTLAVFYDDSRHGPSYVAEAHEVIASSVYSCAEDGTEIYDINGFRITQAVDGLVKVTRVYNKCLIRTSPGNGSATLTTPGIHCTASLGKTSHLFVRRNEKRMHFDGSCFIVRNAGHSAGFNENNLLIVY
ncbi:uncharacterized protein LOC111080827 isoform X2 [Drosophila obscura]|uniref:uncharacterized protein LOC111080827 isoform X2 n=1 Tax=Drosophila obscura TaxID=7282 RepID=UPI000BA068C7|nr:uncharacterized protein LOC111080827 isoform X2 [Drosophila obscura]